MRETFSEMTAEALSDFVAYGLAGELRFQVRRRHALCRSGIRNRGRDIDEASLAGLTASWQLIDDSIAAHHRVYLHGASARQAIEIVGFRLEATRDRQPAADDGTRTARAPGPPDRPGCRGQRRRLARGRRSAPRAGAGRRRTALP